MLYANDIQLNEDNKGKKIPVGTHTNCSVTSVDLGENFIDFNYEDSEGRIHNKRVWFPTIDVLYPKEGETTEQAFSREVKDRMAHLVAHLKVFLTKEEIDTFGAPDFPSFAKKTAEVLNPRLNTAKVNLQLIYDKTGQYSEFSRYANSSSKYIEKYEEGVAPTVKPSPWEAKNRMTPKVNDEAVDNSDSTIVY